MESLLGSFQLPFQRRLTKIYTDTKNSYDFVKESPAPAEDPSLTSLHRKLRIQKDRLVSWGLAWSDSSQSADIDESLSRAGLGDVVGSVMATIKDILAEAEPLWQASKRSHHHFGNDGSSDRPSEKLSSITWDRSRFEDLVKDLTTSIDTLFDLSRSRQNLKADTPRPFSPIAVIPAKDIVEEQKLFESTRMQTPQHISPELLIDPQDVKNASGTQLFPTRDSTVIASTTRKIVYLRRDISSTNPWKLDGPPPLTPILLEYAAFDPIYANTGISPSMTRFEKLFAGLQTFQAADRPDFGTLNLIGYFEDSDNARFGLLYELPRRFAPLDPESSGKFGMPSITILSDLLGRHLLEPTLEAKYRLAYNLATSVFELHSKGVVHGNIAAKSVAFFEQHLRDSKSGSIASSVNVRRPFWTAFDLFPDNLARDEDVHDNKWYRHALDPRKTQDTVLTYESRSLELYSLAQLLVEIALWTSSNDIMSAQLEAEPTIMYHQISVRCGSSYLKAVQACWRAIDDDLANHARPDVALQQVYGRVLSWLERCCAIDDGAEEDDALDKPRLSVAVEVDGSLKSEKHVNEASTTREELSKNEKEASLSDKALSVRQVTSESEPSVKPKARLRRFPLNKISQDHLDEWHKVLMPSINQALKGFYRKYPESVEISLESVGETSQKTKPTIVVICTSVGKVRSILKRHFVYDSSTFGLLVCHGMVLRSRKNHQPRRSMAGEEDNILEPLNSQYQERPTNGASIGAFVDGEHLMPVSFGGLIKVDDKTYGLTVHHMLDDPNDTASGMTQSPTLRSADQQKLLENAFKISPFQLPEDDDYGYELSESGSETSSIASVENFDEEEEPRLSEPGDIEGIPKDCGDGYVVTQPAFDDVDESFLPSEEGREDDHLDTFALGEIYASSGIRRRYEDGLTHEIDWALFEFSKERQPARNFIPGGEQHCRKKDYPAEYVPSSKLHDLEVHGLARTSGLQTGRISPGMVVLKIFGRQSPSDSYQVHGGLGIPGDSGAWVIDNEQGRACGHVLAWSSRKKVAYICPMEIIMKDIAEELGAKSVTFPSAPLVPNRPQLDGKTEGDQGLAMETSLDDEAIQTPVLNETLGITNAKSDLSHKYSVSEPQDGVVAAMGALHVSSSVALHG